MSLKNKKIKPYVGVCRGALGELFQGMCNECQDEIVVVSSLIPKYSWAYFTPDEEANCRDQQQLLATPQRTKSFRALSLYCQHYHLPWPCGHWCFHSDLEVARGMASSTADIVAILRCAANYFQKPLSVDDIVLTLAQIERSDSVFLDHPAMFSSSKHQVICEFNKMSPLYALYMHETDTVETDGTQQLLVDFYQQNQRYYQDLYHQARLALADTNAKGICRVSTKSAELSQEILPKQHFHQLYQAMPRFNADGIITAHTGSVVGLLFCHKPDIACLEQVGQFFNELGGYCQYTEIGS